jgi:hypothetical protein
MALKQKPATGAGFCRRNPAYCTPGFGSWGPFWPLPSSFAIARTTYPSPKMAGAAAATSGHFPETSVKIAVKSMISTPSLFDAFYYSAATLRLF